MREILFRGKRSDNGDWVEGGNIMITNQGKRVFIVPTGEYIDDCKTKTGRLILVMPQVEIIPETVGQYTGLTDKNGKKIFEGDIVRADDYIFVIQYGKCGGTPNADNHGYMGFYLEALSEGTKLCAKYGLRDDICYFTDIEVIDNIHDNLLLLKGGAK